MHGITVNAIAPGPFLTDANRRWIGEKPELEGEVAGSVPMGRWGQPEKIGPLALYLASEASSFMTGSVFWCSMAGSCLGDPHRAGLEDVAVFWVELWSVRGWRQGVGFGAVG